MKLKRLIGGVLVAVLVAFALSQTAEAFYISCDIAGWDLCWPWN